jgi:hypothetical protein
VFSGQTLLPKERCASPAELAPLGRTRAIHTMRYVNAHACEPTPDFVGEELHNWRYLPLWRERLRAEMRNTAAPFERFKRDTGRQLRGPGDARTILVQRCWHAQPANTPAPGGPGGYAYLAKGRHLL